MKTFDEITKDNDQDNRYYLDGVNDTAIVCGDNAQKVSNLLINMDEVIQIMEHWSVILELLGDPNLMSGERLQAYKTLKESDVYNCTVEVLTKIKKKNLTNKE